MDPSFGDINNVQTEQDQVPVEVRIENAKQALA